ncbi:MAG: NAD(+)/NADH kinase [Coriobacteriia bacterium]|nr:NAD(+)/NADH kinase [Coriobacteriia bacterium]
MNIALVINSLQPDAVDAAKKAQEHLDRQGLASQVIDAFSLKEPDFAPDLIVALGGDGTMLRAFHLFERSLAPLIGINFGKLGFLSGATSTDLIKALDHALTSDANKEDRALIDLLVHFADLDEPISAIALNEVMIGRGANVKLVATALAINGHDIFTIRGDGLIIATATGSTAYALSAGGPIVSPGYDGMVVVPLASHTLAARAMVTAPDDVIAITLPEEYRSEIIIEVDGKSLELPEAKISKIEIRTSPCELELIKLDSRLFYDTVAQNFFSER